MAEGLSRRGFVRGLIGLLVAPTAVVLTRSTKTSHVQPINFAKDLGREELFELDRRGPYHQWVAFPVQISTDITQIENVWYHGEVKRWE